MGLSSTVGVGALVLFGWLGCCEGFRVRK